MAEVSPTNFFDNLLFLIYCIICSWPLFLEAISSLQSQFDSVAGGEPTLESARLLHDICLLRIYSASPSRSGEIRHLEHYKFDEIDRGKATLSKWVSDKRKNVLTRRDLGCW